MIRISPTFERIVKRSQEKTIPMPTRDDKRKELEKKQRVIDSRRLQGKVNACLSGLLKAKAKLRPIDPEMTLRIDALYEDVIRKYKQ